MASVHKSDKPCDKVQDYKVRSIIFDIFFYMYQFSSSSNSCVYYLETYSFSPRAAIKALKMFTLPILDENIKLLGDEVILQITYDICQWIHANIEEPALSYAPLWEDCVWYVTSYLYDDHSPAYAINLAADKSEPSLKGTLKHFMTRMIRELNSLSV